MLVASVLFATIQAFLPTSSNRSKAIHRVKCVPNHKANVCQTLCDTVHESHDILCPVLVEMLSHW